MDTRIKLTLQNCDYNSGAPSGFPTVIYLDLSKTILFSIYESDYINATFSFNSDNCSIEYEDYETGDLVKVDSQKTFVLSYGQEDKGCYFPGEFTIRVTQNNKAKDYLFQVISRRADYQNITNMRQYVNAFYYGLSTDILKRRNGADDFISNGHTPSFSENIVFMINNMPALLNSINQYIAVKHAETDKREIVMASLGKIDPKSIQWLAKKGMSENKNALSPDKILIKKTVFNIDNKQNQQFKSELFFWNNELNRILSSMKKTYSDISNTIVHLSEEQKKISEHYEEVQYEKHISDKVKKNWFGRRNEIRQSIHQYQDILSFYSQNIKKLYHYKTNIEYIIFNTWIKNVSIIQEPENNISDYRLKLMLNTRNEYLGIKRRLKKSVHGAGYVFGEKCTPKLFETYIYILLINILLDDGFELVNVNAETDDLMLLLSNTSKVTLKKNDLYCDIFYDTELNRGSSDLNESQYVWVNSDHHRPDFIMSFRKNDELMDSKVIEAKWRPLSAIYNEVDDTDITRTLRDYYALAYHRKGYKRLNRNPISKVIAVYPDRQERITSVMGDDILCLGLMPQDDIKESKGYQNLESLLMENDKETE